MRIFLALLFLGCVVCAETIEDKLNSLREEPIEKERAPFHLSLAPLRKELKQRYTAVDTLVKEGADVDDFEELLQEINALRLEIQECEERFREGQVGEIISEGDPYGIWEQEEITVAQFIIEYGSQDYLYVIPPEVAAIKLQLHSTLMIPKESYPSLVEGVLKYNGVGIKEINAYARQLYMIKQDLVAVGHITALRQELDLLDPKERIAFLFSPPVEQLKNAFYFLERIRDPKTTFVYQVGAKIALIGLQEDVKKLVLFCETIWESRFPKVTKVVTMKKMSPDEVIKILKNYFQGLSDASKMVVTAKGGHDLSVLPLAKENGVILVGSQDIVQRAEMVIKETEAQVDDPYELTVYWYMCSHSNPTELSEILQQIYGSLINSKVEGVRGRIADRGEEFEGGYADMIPPAAGENQGALFNQQNEMLRPGWNGQPGGMGGKAKFDQKEFEVEKIKRQNFIPYPATGSILMVIRKDTLPKIKEVLKKLDIPKRMVELEVLLCERSFSNSINGGLNLLKIGTQASGTKEGGITYEANEFRGPRGIFEFFFSRPSSTNFPAFDVTYNFLLSQEDIRVSACPSVIAINQTPATIAITDQISIDKGATPTDMPNNKIFIQKSYDRADFGITLTLTPTIHEPDLDDPEHTVYVTLENNIAFERIKRNSREQDRPDVHKRQIKNQVRIADGQTVILGGLRSKTSEDKNEKLPFLGEIPGIGKLFGTNSLHDKSDEMFIFIKPRVIHDPRSDLLCIREELLKERPGDLDKLLEEVREATERKKAKRFQDSFSLIFGDPNNV